MRLGQEKGLFLLEKSVIKKMRGIEVQALFAVDPG
jgi:hypothetical protein